jgi:hypothetical protein
VALIWPSGWAWESGPPYQSHLFMMIVGIYATLGVFLLNAARNQAANLSLIWFTVVSSVVHAAIMRCSPSATTTSGTCGEMSRRCFLVAVVLSVLVLSSGLKQSAAAPSSAR